VDATKGEAPGADGAHSGRPETPRDAEDYPGRHLIGAAGWGTGPGNGYQQSVTADPTTPGEDPARHDLVEALLGLRWALPRTDADARAAVAQLDMVAGQLRALYDQVTVDPLDDDLPAWTAPVGSLIAQSAFALDWWRPVLEDVDLDWTINHQAHLSADLSGIASAGAQILDQIEPMAPPFPQAEPDPFGPVEAAAEEQDAAFVPGFEPGYEPGYEPQDYRADPALEPQAAYDQAPYDQAAYEQAAYEQAAYEQAAAERDEPRFEPDYGPQADPRFEIRYQDPGPRSEDQAQDEAQDQDQDQGQDQDQAHDQTSADQRPPGSDGPDPQEPYTPPRGQQSHPQQPAVRPPHPSSPFAHPASAARGQRPHPPGVPKRPGKPADKRVAAVFGSVGTTEPPSADLDRSDLDRSDLDRSGLDNSGRHRRPAYEFESAAPPPWSAAPAPIPPGPVSFAAPRPPTAPEPLPVAGMAQRRSGFSFDESQDSQDAEPGYRPPSVRPPQRRTFAHAGMGVQTLVIGGAIAGLCWWAVVALGSHPHTVNSASGSSPTAAHTEAADLAPSTAAASSPGTHPSASPSGTHASAPAAGGAEAASMQMSLLGGSSQAPQVAVILAVRADGTGPLTVSIDYYGMQDGKRVAERYATWNLKGKTEYDLGDSIPSSAYCGDDFTVVATSGATTTTKSTTPGC
jgi:hypothetical protein